MAESRLGGHPTCAHGPHTGAAADPGPVLAIEPWGTSGADCHWPDTGRVQLLQLEQLRPGCLAPPLSCALSGQETRRKARPALYPTQENRALLHGPGDPGWTLERTGAFPRIPLGKKTMPRFRVLTSGVCVCGGGYKAILGALPGQGKLHQPPHPDSGQSSRPPCPHVGACGQTQVIHPVLEERLTG